MCGEDGFVSASRRRFLASSPWRLRVWTRPSKTVIPRCTLEHKGVHVYGDKDESGSNCRGAVARMDASRGSGLASGYNSAVERLRETEYPMLNGMPSGENTGISKTRG